MVSYVIKSSSGQISQSIINQKKEKKNMRSGAHNNPRLAALRCETVETVPPHNPGSTVHPAKWSEMLSLCGAGVTLSVTTRSDQVQHRRRSDAASMEGSERFHSSH